MAADEESFRSFYAATCDPLKSYLYHRCGGSRELTRDLVQETYLAVVAAWRCDRVLTPTLPWVMTIARNKLVDHVRRMTRELRHLHAVAMEASRDDELGRFAAESTRDEVLAALWSLPHEQRLALSLRHLDGLSVPDVAAQLGRTVAATETLLTRARRAMRQRLEEVRRG